MPTDFSASTDEKSRPDKHGRKLILTGALRVPIVAVILFGSAGTIAWAAGWVFLLTTIAFMAASSVVLIRINPELLNVRGKKTEGAAWHDTVIMKGWPLCQLLGIIVAGLDYGRFHWSLMPLYLVIIGWVLLVTGSALLTWSMAVNRHFEVTVRIQTDREHRVCSEGPYRFVRHPGYTGIIMAAFGSPLLLGSWPAIAFGLITAILFIARTRIEDRVLMAELPGYLEFANQTRKKLLPGLW